MGKPIFRLACLLLVASALVAGVRKGSVEAKDGARIRRNQADVFAKQYGVVTLDLAGHGESSANLPKWTVLGLAEDVRAVADKLHLERMILVGHSIGGPVSLEAAHLLKERVLGVIAVDTLHDASMKIPAQMVESIAAKLTADFPGTMGGFMGSMFSKNADPAVRQWVETKAKGAHPEAAADEHRRKSETRGFRCGDA
jgi:pimeloyl-ACP methyl ester carboxylesterase